MEDNLVVLIPASRFVDFELRSEFGHIPPVLLPIDQTNVISKITKLYGSQAKLLLGYHQGKELVDQYISQALLPLTCIDVGNTIDIGHTIYKMLLSQGSLEDVSVIIHFGDTLMSSDLLQNHQNTSDFILVSEVNDPWRWTIAKQENKLLRFIDKEAISNNEKNQAVVGIIKISKADIFFNLLREAIVDSLDTGHQSFFTTLSNYSKQCFVNVINIEENNWVDAGHLDRLNEQRKNMRARAFNSVQLDYKKGIFTKRSENKQKLINEILWYVNLPKPLQFCIPRIFDYSVEADSPFVSMDYYGYPSLADIFVHGNLEIQKWSSLLKDLKWLLNEFSQFPCQLSSEEIYKHKKEMYVQKVQDRLKAFPFTGELEIIAKGGNVNGIEVMSLTDCLDSLEDTFKRYISKDNHSFKVMHGDFCLSNILFDSRSNTFRIIDPRGSFGEVFIFGDPYYDIAKLSHSIRGYYDFIVREQFYFNREGTDIIFTPFVSGIHHKLTKHFEEIFIRDETERDIINFIESTLFLSMIPLHHDSSKRQIGMLVTGLMKYSSLLNKQRSFR